MSEVLKEFVTPYLPRDWGQEDLERVLKAAVTAWNISLLPFERQLHTFRDLSEIMGRSEAREFAPVLAAMILRKVEHFSAHKRFIVSYEVSRRLHDFHLSVASTDVEEPIERQGT